MTHEGQVPPKETSYLKKLIQDTQHQPDLVRGVVGDTLRAGMRPCLDGCCGCL